MPIKPKLLVSSQKTSSTVQCQKCLEKGHWTYECKNERKYLHRPTRTKEMEKELKKKQADQMEKSRIEIQAIRDKASSKKKRSRKKSPSSSEGSSSSSSSSDDSSTESSSSSGSDSGATSGSDSSSDADSSSISTSSGSSVPKKKKKTEDLPAS